MDEELKMDKECRGVTLGFIESVTFNPYRFTSINAALRGVGRAGPLCLRSIC